MLARPFSIAEAVRKLAPGIRQMQSKGYTLEQIAGALGAEGLTVSAHTLKRHLSNGKSVARSNPRPTATRAAS